MAVVWVIVTQCKRYCCRSPARAFVLAFLVLIIIGSWYLSNLSPKSKLSNLGVAGIGPENSRHLGNRDRSSPGNVDDPNINRVHHYLVDKSPASSSRPTESMAERVAEIRAAQKVSQFEAQQSESFNGIEDKDKRLEQQLQLKKEKDLQEVIQKRKSSQNEMEKEMKGVEDVAENKSDLDRESDRNEEKLNEIQDKTNDEDSNETKQKEIDHDDSIENQVEEDVNEDPEIKYKKEVRSKLAKVHKEENAGREGDGKQHGPVEKKNKGLSTFDNRTKGKKKLARKQEKGNEEHNVLMTLVKVTRNSQLTMGFQACVTSICKHTSISLTFNIVADKESRFVAREIFGKLQPLCNQPFMVKYYDVLHVSKKLKPVIKMFRELFSAAKNSYYDDPVFFLKAVIHEALPTSIKQIIALDSDMKFRSDIKDLFDMFSDFAPSNIMGLAYEQQPTYRHIIYKYRDEHKGTKLGDPPPAGIPGFNTGVALINLENMRRAHIYNQLLNGEAVKEMAHKYHFKGHLGDQDFFSLISFDYQELFHIIPCSWNRQLCTYWQKVYTDVFHAYHRCTKPIHVYHGNCRTHIPDV